MPNPTVVSGGTICSSTDQTFYCRMSRLTSEFHMVISVAMWFIIMPLILVYYLQKHGIISIKFLSKYIKPN